MHDGINKLILESAHSYMVYMSLVPEGKLLKWAEVMMHAANALKGQEGVEEDMKKAEHNKFLFERELKSLVYDPIFAIADSINKKIHTIEVPSDELTKVSGNIDAACQRCEKSRLEEEYDVVELKRTLIGAVNRCFKYLNKVQDYEYPVIPHREEMIRHDKGIH